MSHWSSTYCCSIALPYFTLVKHILLFTSTALLHTGQTHTAVHKHCTTSHWSSTYCCSIALPYFTLVKHILLFTSTALLHTGQTHTAVHKHCTTSHWSNTYCCSQALPYFTLVKHICSQALPYFTLIKHILLFTIAVLLHTEQCSNTCPTSHWAVFKHILLFNSTALLHTGQTHTAVHNNCTTSNWWNTYCCSILLKLFTNISTHTDHPSAAFKHFVQVW